jgi:hypothetical protein
VNLRVRIDKRSARHLTDVSPRLRQDIWILFTPDKRPADPKEKRKNWQKTIRQPAQLESAREFHPYCRRQRESSDLPACEDRLIGNFDGVAGGITTTILRRSESP